MFCTKCGAEVADNQAFCTNCGDNLRYQYNMNPNMNPGMNPNININVNAMAQVSPKSRIVAAVLCFFFGCFGVHRFYVGKAGTGFLYLFTAGLFGIGALVDFIMILCGAFKDGSGYPIKN